MKGSTEDRRRLRRKLLVRIAILVVILFVASLVAWRLGYFKLLGSGGLRRLMSRLHRVPWIGPLYIVGFAILAALGSRSIERHVVSKIASWPSCDSERGGAEEETGRRMHDGSKSEKTA
jgi:hypothetical protein